MNYNCIFKHYAFFYNSHMNYIACTRFILRYPKSTNNIIFWFHQNPKYLNASILVRCSSDRNILKPSSNPIEINTLKKLPSNDIGDKNESSLNSVPIKEKEIKKSLWRRFLDEIIHYYHGFKLLFLEIKVTLGILNKIARGNTMTRRERKQLVRTAADLVRMIPFMVFIVVPFVELLLPLYLKFFPFMLPSTFQVETKDNEKVHQKLKGKLEIAKFLQEAIAESAAIKKVNKQDGVDLVTFSNFLKEVRESGLIVETKDIIRFSHLFEDEVTLESLDSKYLKALCKLLDINTIGPQALLRFKLKMKVRELKVDDQMISNEGIDKVPVWELQQLCRERGMRSFGVSEVRLRYQLSQWLSLHLEKKVPTTLLLLSRVMYLPETLTTEEQLKQAILVLPETVSNTAKLKIVDTEKKIDPKTKFEVIKEEQKVIKKERLEARKSAIEAPLLGIQSIKEDFFKLSEDKAPLIKVSSDESKISEMVVNSPQKKPSVETKESIPNISATDLAFIESAVLNVKDKKTVLHKEELNTLKENQDQISRLLSLHQEVVPTVSSESKAAKMLSNKLNKMIEEIGDVVENINGKKSKIVKDESQKKETVSDFSIDRFSTTPSSKAKHFIDIKDLLESLHSMHKNIDNKKWLNILTLLDEDQDGKIELDHLIKAIKLLGSEDIKLSSSEIGKLLEVINKEEKIAEIKKPEIQNE